jgi:hypothetical protein
MLVVSALFEVIAVVGLELAGDPEDERLVRGTQEEAVVPTGAGARRCPGSVVRSAGTSAFQPQALGRLRRTRRSPPGPGRVNQGRETDPARR